jgi:hypothetical protein
MIDIDEFVLAFPESIRGKIVDDVLEAVEGFLSEGETLASSIEASTKIREKLAILYAKAQTYEKLSMLELAQNTFAQYSQLVAQVQAERRLNIQVPSSAPDPGFSMNTTQQLFKDEDIEKW